MMDRTPLLMLLDSILRQDEVQVRSVMGVIGELTGLPVSNCSWSGPLRSADSLCQTVQTLVALYPQMTSIPSKRDGSLPLHYAANLGIWRLFEQLWSQYPPAIIARNSKGKIPLHYAAREGHLEIVRSILSSYPHAASIPSDKQKLALHFAAAEGHVHIVRHLLAVYPAGASCRTLDEKLPIHLAARWGHLQIAQDLHAVFSAGVMARDWEGSLPLHDAAGEGQYNMARYLLELYPEALTKVNLREEVPLFLAVRSWNVAMVILLAQAWPAGSIHVLRHLSAADRVENWEILEILLRSAVYAFQASPPLAAVGEARDEVEKSATVEEDERLFNSLKMPPLGCKRVRTTQVGSLEYSQQQAHKKGMRRKRLRVDDYEQGTVGDGSFSWIQPDSTPRQFFPVHAAFQARASHHVLQMVLDKVSDDKLQRDELGRLPIHYAMECCCQNEEVIRIVLDQLITPVSARMRDTHNQLPLHIAIANRADVRVINRLLEASPEAVTECCQSNDLWFDQLPLDMALHFNCDLSTIYTLLREDPSYVRTNITFQ